VPQALTVPIKCRNGSTTEKHLSRGHQELFISSGCEAEFPKSIQEMGISEDQLFNSHIAPKLSIPALTTKIQRRMKDILNPLGHRTTLLDLLTVLKSRCRKPDKYLKQEVIRNTKTKRRRIRLRKLEPFPSPSPQKDHKI
jgi:hypothetical protein